MAKDGFKRIKVKRGKHFGQIDLKKKIIKVNVSKKKNKRRGEIIDSMVHEETHRLHPRMGEKNVKKLTEKRLKRMSAKQKQKLRGKYKAPKK